MQIIELVAATIGIIYVWLEMKASLWLWPVGIVLPLFYIYISWKGQVYGNVLVNTYYIIACIWGWHEWLKHKKSGTADEKPITRMPKKYRVFIGGITVLLWVILRQVMDRYMQSPFPIWDALATAVSLVGMWLLGKKYIENWYSWISSNAIFCLLFFIQGYVITGCFFVIYTVIAIFGYFNWRKLMTSDAYGH
ncbi:MAG: nicotinamide riboside transporter PnuC [Porphyromonas sp.]|nr:nicotinamide riboside transporter PnuC [Porphyromonas sp.]